MRKSGLILTSVVFFASLALYLLTLAPTFIPIDSAEFTLCMVNLGICHPPGFFLYILVGKIFLTLLPIGSLIYKANVLSAFFGALTVLVVFQILKNLKLNQTYALFLALLLATTSFFWQFSLSADIFTFGSFLMVVSLYFWTKQQIGWSFLFLGLASSHYYIPIFLLPVFLYFSFSKKDPLRSIQHFGLFCLGFVPQGLMLWRMTQNPVINWGQVSSFSDFINYVSRQEFGTIYINANPLQLLTVSNLWNNWLFFWLQLSLNFGLILPLLIILPPFYRSREAFFWLTSFLVILSVQIWTIATVNPFDFGRVFQTEKFLILPALFGVILIGLSLNIFIKRFKNYHLLVFLLLTAALILNLSLNFGRNNYQSDYFSQNLVEDALSELPANSIAIIVTHQIYFEGLYEMQILHKFPQIELIYFPNARNNDPKLYHPDLFQKPLDQNLINQIASQQLNVGEGPMVELIARNLDRPTFIKQGSFENVYFQTLRPFLSPFGLWWRVDLNKQNYSPLNDPLLSQVLENEQLSPSQLRENNEQQDLLTYSFAYHSLALELGKIGKYDLAIAQLKKAQAIDTKAPNFASEIDLLSQTRDLEQNQAEFLTQKNKNSLNKLGQDYLIIGNFSAGVAIFEKVSQLFPDDAKSYSNLGIAYSSAGKNDLAKAAFVKALQIDPSLEYAKNGLQNLR